MIKNLIEKIINILGYKKALFIPRIFIRSEEQNEIGNKQCKYGNKQNITCRWR